MTEEQLKEIIKEYISENLSIDVEKDRGSYGMSDSVRIKIYLDGKVISTAWLE